MDDIRRDNLEDLTALALDIVDRSMTLRDALAWHARREDRRARDRIARRRQRHNARVRHANTQEAA